jgi:acyl dehydratase
MVAQIIPGDTAVIEGRVTKKYRDGLDHRVEIELTASNALGVAARSWASLAMPSEAAGEVTPLLELEQPNVIPHSDMPQAARAQLGKRSPRSPGAYPISEVQIMYWCDMVEDANPLYVEGEYAQKCRHRGVIAPPMGLISWSMGRAGRTGADPDAPDVDCPERKPWPPIPEGAPRRTGGFTPPGATDTIATQSVQSYGKPLRPGDRIYSTTELLDCSPLKKTRLGLGYFQTNLSTYTNQAEEIVGTNIFTLLRYGVPDEAAASPATDS